MKRLALCLLLAGCGPKQPEEHYGFVARLGNDTVSVESVSREGNTLVTDEVDRFPRVRQRHTSISLGDLHEQREVVRGRLYLVRRLQHLASFKTRRKL